MKSFCFVLKVGIARNIAGTKLLDPGVLYNILTLTYVCIPNTNLVLWYSASFKFQLKHEYVVLYLCVIECSVVIYSMSI